MCKILKKIIFNYMDRIISGELYEKNDIWINFNGYYNVDINFY